jgi:hypothetical protein
MEVDVCAEERKIVGGPRGVKASLHLCPPPIEEEDMVLEYRCPFILRG